ncbi:three-helix bundle dimerization domain-containing protein [Cryobacterium ruanii]|uniref:three-helix bundle dimerization domain-containing protein n=1 Tax=Cryobacterium ruanii TaxID=1259197 RepID=UPI003BB0CB62
MDAIQERHAVDDVARRLEVRYSDVPADRVHAVVTACYDSLSDKPIRDFIPVLVEHEARSRLRAERPETHSTRDAGSAGSHDK